MRKCWCYTQDNQFNCFILQKSFIPPLSDGEAGEMRAVTKPENLSKLGPRRWRSNGRWEPNSTASQHHLLAAPSQPALSHRPLQRGPFKGRCEECFLQVSWRGQRFDHRAARDHGKHLIQTRSPTPYGRHQLTHPWRPPRTSWVNICLWEEAVQRDEKLTRRHQRGPGKPRTELDSGQEQVSHLSETLRASKSPLQASVSPCVMSTPSLPRLPPKWTGPRTRW